MTTTGGGNIFTLRDVSKTFNGSGMNPFGKRSRICALDSVSMEIPAHRITCLLGPNGAGKTTLIKILASLITPDSGEIRPGGSAPVSVGLVTPNERSFYWRLTGRQNLLFFGALYNLRGRALRERVADSLAETGMTEVAEKPYRFYSAGMKQKLNIARALLGMPILYLLDEPAAHLDPLAREEFRDFVSGVLMKKRGATVFLCTHDLEEARHLADRIVVLDAGRVVASGIPSELGVLLDGGRELVIRYSGDVPRTWLDRWGDAAVFDGQCLIRVRFDGRTTGPETLVRSFVEAGGNIREVTDSSDDLLALLHRKVGKNV